jgi:hypothetical protein
MNPPVRISTSHIRLVIRCRGRATQSCIVSTVMGETYRDVSRSAWNPEWMVK